MFLDSQPARSPNGLAPNYPPLLRLSPSLLSSNCFPHNLLSDPHALNPVLSIFYENLGGQGAASSLALSLWSLPFIPFFPIFYALFPATGSPQLLWNPFVAHSFHRDGGVPPFLPNGYSQGLPWPSGRSIAIKDFSFTSHRPAPSVSGSRVALHCYFFLLHMGHDNVTSHSATKDQKRCSTHGMTFLQGTTSRPIFKR